MKTYSKLIIEFDEENDILIEAKLQRKQKTFFSSYKDTNYFDIRQIRSYTKILLENLKIKNENNKRK